MASIRTLAYKNKLTASIYLMVIFAILTAIIYILPAFVTSLWIIISLISLTFNGANGLDIVKTFQLAAILALITAPNKFLQKEISNTLGVILK